MNYTTCKYLGIEIDETIVDNRIKELVESNGGKIIYADCMSDNVYKEIERFVNGGRTIIYCDNGNKAEEIKHFYPILKKDDILLTHDFTDGTRNVRGLSYHYYNLREVTEDDIRDLDNNKELQRLPEEIFKETRNIGWIRL